MVACGAWGNPWQPMNRLLRRAGRPPGTENDVARVFRTKEAGRPGAVTETSRSFPAGIPG